MVRIPWSAIEFKMSLSEFEAEHLRVLLHQSLHYIVYTKQISYFIKERLQN